MFLNLNPGLSPLLPRRWPHLEDVSVFIVSSFLFNEPEGLPLDCERPHLKVVNSGGALYASRAESDVQMHWRRSVLKARRLRRVKTRHFRASVVFALGANDPQVPENVNARRAN